MSSTTDPILILSTLDSGQWRVVLHDPRGRPEVEVWLGEQRLPGLVVTEEAPGQWRAQLPVPVDVLSDGVHVLVLRSGTTGRVLGHLPVSAGVAASADLADEVAVLRAELEMVKAALRRLAASAEPKA